MSLNKNHKEMPPNAGAVTTTRSLYAFEKQLLSLQEKGDDKLKKARDLISREIPGRTFVPELEPGSPCIDFIEEKITL